MDISCPVDESFDPLSPGYLADPYAVLASLPDGEQPIFFAPAIGYYVLTSSGAATGPRLAGAAPPRRTR